MSISNISVRPLEKNEWALLKNIRLLALQTTPGAFSASYEAATQRFPEDWKNLINGQGHQVFGLFSDAKIIGITGILTDRADPSGKTAILVMSFILPEYRGRGLAKMLYDIRLQWAREHPRITTIVVSHRKSNDASRRANQHYGFRFVREEIRKWPDGQEESELFYEKHLSDFNQPEANSYQNSRP